MANILEEPETIRVTRLLIKIYKNSVGSSSILEKMELLAPKHTLITPYGLNKALFYKLKLI